jgi:phage shock protein B
MDDNSTAGFIVLVVMVGVVILRFLKLLMQRKPGPGPQDFAAMEQMGQIAARLEQRVATLERILDAEVPSWRGSQSAIADMPARGARP